MRRLNNAETGYGYERTPQVDVRIQSVEQEMIVDGPIIEGEGRCIL